MYDKITFNLDHFKGAGHHGYLSSFYHQFDDFYQCVQKPGRDPFANAGFSIGEMKTALAMEKSDQEGQWIEINLFE